MATQIDPLKPPATVLVKLGSIAIHVEEMLQPHGHAFDKHALDSLMNDPEVAHWLSAMDKMALLPVKRKGFETF